MSGYFKFDITVNDGVQEASIPVKIVIINEDNNRISLTFTNPSNEVNAKKEAIKELFTEVFASERWTFNIDKIDGPNDQIAKIDGGQTVAKCHFLQTNFEPVPVGLVEGAIDGVIANISNGLSALNLTLNYKVCNYILRYAKATIFIVK